MAHRIRQTCVQLFSLRSARMCRCHVCSMGITLDKENQVSVKPLRQQETLSPNPQKWAYYVTKRIKCQLQLGLMLKAHYWDSDVIQSRNGFGGDTSWFSRQPHQILWLHSFRLDSSVSLISSISTRMASFRSIGSLASLTHSPRDVSRSSGTVFFFLRILSCWNR